MADRVPGALSRRRPGAPTPRRGHFDDPRYYDKAYSARRDDVAFYRELALRVGGPVLEYGIGNGRVALEIARAGVEVVGVDCCRPMLDDLRTKLEHEPPVVRRRVKGTFGDMRTRRLGRRFPLVIAPFNVVLHLYTRRDFERFLLRVRDHLTSAGRLVFDFSLPHPEDLALDPERWFGSPRFRDPTSGKLVRYHERFAYDSLTQLLCMTFRFTPVDGSAPWETELVHRQWYPEELAAVLHYAGFRVVRRSAEFRGEAPGPGSDTLVVECKPGRAPEVL